MGEDGKDQRVNGCLPEAGRSVAQPGDWSESRRTGIRKLGEAPGRRLKLER